MRGKVLFLVILLTAVPLSVPAQWNKQWRFGDNAGVDFSSGTAVPVAGNCSAQEGTASISNADGELLLYTNGQQVWNRNGEVMPSGNGLLGSWSSAQTLIVPQPGHCDRYYIFTTTDNAGDSKFRYTLVDLCLDQGLGNVVVAEKNVVLQSNTSEAIVAMSHSNGVDIWVISYSMVDRAFHAFLLTEQGIATTPVTSLAGIQFNATQNIDQLEGSHSGDKIVHVALWACDLLDFDPATGMVETGSDLCSQFGIPEGGYDAVFSPDDTKLYVSTDGWTPLLRQLDLSTGTTTVLGSLTTPSGGYGGIQLGPDGKVYVARMLRYYLDVIHEPNLPGIACGYEDQGLPMPRSCRVGLPSALTAVSYTTKVPPLEVELGPDITACPGAPIELSVDLPCNATVQWSNGAQLARTEVFAPDTIVAEVHSTCASGTDTLIIHALQSDHDTTFQLPNVLTPNNDGMNDSWSPDPDRGSDATFTIFDRWGNTVFSSTGSQDHWDGRHDDRSPAADGVYYYICTMNFHGPCSSHSVRDQGHITLFR